MTIRNVVIVVGRCSHSKERFGIRMERSDSNYWVATWAFAIKEAVAKREGYEATRVEGSFGFDQSYPGCPHCSAPCIFQCGCGKVACWNGESSVVTCPSCGSSGELGGHVTSLQGGGDR